MQKPFKDWPIDPNTTSGTELAETLNRMVESNDSQNLGGGRPSYLSAGGLWCKGSDGAVDLYLFDGTKDVLIGGSASGDGGMAISQNPPPNPSVGDMWHRLPSNEIMVWNGDYWYQFPASGGAGGGAGTIIDGLENGQMLFWNGSAWEPTSAARIHQTGRGPFFDIAGEFHIHPEADEFRKSPWGGKIKSQVFLNFNDKWLNKTVDWNMTWFEPNDDNTNANRLNGFDFWADRFQIRIAPSPLDDPFDVDDIVFKADGRDVHIGVRDYRAKVHTYGDLYTGMSENFYGEIIPTNPDDKPGTLFSGGMVCLGSYIDGETLQPINQEERDNPALIRQRAFVRDSGIDMTYNPIYYLPDPDEPRWRQLRDSMPPTMKWLEENSIVANEEGVLVCEGDTQFGESNSSEHDFRGDVYIGYSDGQSRPDNNDERGGTLFLERGLIVGRGNKGGASINMEDNVIYNVGDPTSDTCAPSVGYIKRELIGDWDPDINIRIKDLYEEQIRQAVRIQRLEGFHGGFMADLETAVQSSTKFAELKEGLLEVIFKYKELPEEGAIQ